MTSIARRNPTAPCAHEVSWRKYAAARRSVWTWTPPIQHPFCPFATIGAQIILTLCGTLMLALVIFMAGSA